MAEPLQPRPPALAAEELGAAALPPASTATPEGAQKAPETQHACVSIDEHTHIAFICL